MTRLARLQHQLCEQRRLIDALKAGYEERGRVITQLLREKAQGIEPLVPAPILELQGRLRPTVH